MSRIFLDQMLIIILLIQRITFHVSYVCLRDKPFEYRMPTQDTFKTKATSEFTETVILINGISTVSDIFVWQIEMVDFGNDFF